MMFAGKLYKLHQITKISYSKSANPTPRTESRIYPWNLHGRKRISPKMDFAGTPVVLLHLGGPEGSDLQHRTPQRGGFTDPLESLGTGHPGVTLGVGEGAKRMVS